MSTPIFPLSLETDSGPSTVVHKPALRRSARQLAMAQTEFSDAMDIDGTSSNFPPALPTDKDAFDELITATIRTPVKKGPTEAELYQQHLLTPLPVIHIPAVTNAGYEAHNATLPLNINFQARVRRSGGIRALYPNTAVDEVMRLYYPDYQSWDRILNEGIIGRMGVPSVDDIVNISIIIKRRGIGWEEEDNSGEKFDIRPMNGDWDNILALMRGRKIGTNVGSGLRGAHTVKLLIKLLN